MKKELFYLGIIFLLLPFIGKGQGEHHPQSRTDTLSYVMERVYLGKTQTEHYGCRTTMSYLDGFGHVMQEVVVNGSPDKWHDLIFSYEYDYRGRLLREYLPFVDTERTTRGVYRTERTSDGYGSTNTYTTYVYDATPYDRIAKVTAPGSRDGKGVEMAYGLNGVEDVRLYRVGRDGTLEWEGYYEAGKLQKTTVTNEDRRVAVSYTDNMGREVLGAEVVGSERLETYSVYDDYGRLRWVLSPEAGKHLADGIDTAVLLAYAYRYDYDVLGRLTKKWLPGCAPVYYVYDSRDRVVLAQDGEQRKLGRWDYVLYDRNGRIVEEGEVVLPGKNRETLEAEAWNVRDYVPMGTREAYRYRLYDTYSGNGTVTPHAFSDTSGYSDAYHEVAIGRLTAVKERVLGSSEWKTTTFYYDVDGEVLQQVKDNALGGVSRSDMKYDRLGNVQWRREHHSDGTDNEDIFEWSTSYDVYGRQQGVLVSLNDGENYSMQYDYDPQTGRRSHIYVPGTYTVEESYNLRGWLTRLETGEYWEELEYYAGGLIKKMAWQHAGMMSRGYDFTYDGYGRLTEGVMRGVYDGTTFGERGITYDGNGNILSLSRTSNGVVVDSLEYVYTGNHLSALSEHVRSVDGDIYPGGTAVLMGYGYDGNGNLVWDERRGLLFCYNRLNLLEKVCDEAGEVKATYRWLADGTKLGVRDGSGGNGYEYAGSLVYRVEGGERRLEGALWEGGMVLEDADGGQHGRYFIRDHLGSVRVVMENEEVVERNDFYPFGARHDYAGYVKGDNRYLFNGKEEQKAGGLGWLDYGARMYDAELGRWWSIDPAGEDYLSLSPYHFSGNNPISYVDWNGMDYWGTNDPEEIEQFMGALQNGDNTFDFAGWNHASDAEFLADLTYDDEAKRYYSSYGAVVDGVATRIGVSLDADITPIVESYPYSGAFVRAPLNGFAEHAAYYLGIGGYDRYIYDGAFDKMDHLTEKIFPWGVSAEGRLVDIIKLVQMGTPPLPTVKGNGIAKTLKGATKGMPHGDSGRELIKAEKRIELLREQLKTATGKEKTAIKNRIKNISKIAQKKAKGETHWRK